MATHYVDVDIVADKLPDATELENYKLRMNKLSRPLCNGQTLIRLYGSRYNLAHWLKAEYQDDDGAYKANIKEVNKTPWPPSKLLYNPHRG